MNSDYDIGVKVLPEYLPEQSAPHRSLYAFAYHITIANNGNKPAQLISRHWIITDSRNQIKEVQGLGVIGEQPRLEPGESFQYSSGVVLDTETGTMEGSYQMQTDEGDKFDVDIPTFLLAIPGVLH